MYAFVQKKTIASERLLPRQLRQPSLYSDGGFNPVRKLNRIFSFLVK